MALKDVLPGKYRAKAIKGAWGKTKEKETPCVAVMFEFKNGDSLENIWWTGYLTNTPVQDGASTVFKKTLENLAMLGYDESKGLDQDENGNPVFTRKEHLADKEVDIVIDIEEYNGKSFHRVKWINELGGSHMAGMSINQVIGNIDLRAEMAAARARLGMPAPKITQQPAAISNKPDMLPF